MMKMVIRYICPACDARGVVTIQEVDTEKHFACKKCGWENSITVSSFAPKDPQASGKEG